MAETNLDSEIQILTRAADIGLAALNSKIDTINENGEIISQSTFVGAQRDSIRDLVYDSIIRIHNKVDMV